MTTTKNTYNCKICGNDELIIPFDGTDVLHRCKICNYVTKIYGDSVIYENFQNIVEHYRFKGSENIISSILKDSLERRQNTVLDVGCWDGSLLNCLPENWVKFGVEPNLSAANRVKNKKITIIQKQFLKADFKNKNFDLVLLIDVIEHLNDPLENLVKIYSILKPKGSLIILTGNTDSFGCRLFKNNWYYYHYKSHISFFNKSNFKLLLKKSGFRKMSTIETKHYTTRLRILFNRIIDFKKRQVTNGINKIEMNSSSINKTFILLSRVLKNKDHIIIKCER